MHLCPQQQGGKKTKDGKRDLMQLSLEEMDEALYDPVTL
jgi:hypothetical protein